MLGRKQREVIHFGQSHAVVLRQAVAHARFPHPTRATEKEDLPRQVHALIVQILPSECLPVQRSFLLKCRCRRWACFRETSK